MVKKSYVAPAANEARTKLRATILAGSTPGIGAGSDPVGGGNTGSVGQGGNAGTDGDNNITDARQRGASSLD